MNTHNTKPRAHTMANCYTKAQIVGLIAATTTLLVLTSTPEVQAQELELPEARQGYFIGGGLALMTNSNDSNEEGTIGPLTGSYFNFRIGEMVTDWLGFGFHAGGGTGSDDRWSTGYGGAMLDVQFVPFDHWAFRLGVGAGGLSATDSVEEQDTLLGTGGAYYLVGVTYDYFPFHTGGESGGVSFTPTLQLIHLPGDVFSSFIVALGVETLWWSGLDKNKLELPDDEAYSKEE